MFDIITIASQIPATGDNFPVIPLVIVVVIAVVIAVISTILSKKKK